MDLYSSISDLKKVYQPRCNIVKDEKGDLVRDSHIILARFWKYFFQLFNIQGVSDVRQTEVHTAVPLVPDPSALEIELTNEELKSHKSSGIDQIKSESIKADRKTLRYEIHKLIISIWKKQELREEWKESIIVPIYRKGDKTDCSNYSGITL